MKLLLFAPTSRRSGTLSLILEGRARAMSFRNDSKTVLEATGAEVATRAGGARRYRKPLTAFRWSDIKSLLIESFEQWNKHNATRLGASLAFYSLLSLAPLLLVLVSVVGLIFGHSAAQRQIVQQLQALIGPAAGKAAAAFLQGSHNTAHGVVATVVGLITLLFSASGVVIELRAALNVIWEVSNRTENGLDIITNFLKERLFSFVIVLGIGFLLVVSLAITTLISSLGALATSIPGPLAAVLQILNSFVSFGIIASVFAAIYKIMPDVPIEWRDVALGGIVTSVLFTAGKFVLGFYLGRASYGSTYGAAGSIVVLIAWIYYSGQIFFLGAEFTRAFTKRYGSQPNGKTEALVKPFQDADPEVKPRLISPSDSA